MDRPVCADQLGLAGAVVKAVQAVYDARAEHGRVIKEKQDPAVLADALAEARKTEREAVHALDDHRKEHNC